MSTHAEKLACRAAKEEIRTGHILSLIEAANSVFMNQDVNKMFGIMDSDFDAFQDTSYDFTESPKLLPNGIYKSLFSYEPDHLAMMLLFVAAELEQLTTETVLIVNSDLSWGRGS